MHTWNRKKIAIVGGGPGGLTLARLLQQQGADVTVYERDRNREARVQGSALDLHETSGLAALDAAGLMDQFWAKHRPDLNQLRLTDHNGTILHDHARSISGAGKRPEIERGPLRDLLLDSLADGTVHWDHKLESASSLGEQVELRFANGITVHADLAVGCDGANSRLRALVTPVRPRYVGVTLVEGLVPEAKEAVPELWTLLDDAALMALGANERWAWEPSPTAAFFFMQGSGAKHPIASNKSNKPIQRKSVWPGFDRTLLAGAHGGNHYWPRLPR